MQFKPTEPQCPITPTDVKRVIESGTYVSQAQDNIILFTLKGHDCIYSLDDQTLISYTPVVEVPEPITVEMRPVKEVKLIGRRGMPRLVTIKG